MLIAILVTLILCLAVSLIVVALRPRPQSDVMQQVVGDAPRRRHMRSVEEEAL